jgi:hypothetical protein
LESLQQSQSFFAGIKDKLAGEREHALSLAGKDYEAERDADASDGR